MEDKPVSPESEENLPQDGPAHNEAVASQPVDANSEATPRQESQDTPPVEEAETTPPTEVKPGSSPSAPTAPTVKISAAPKIVVSKGKSKKKWLLLGLLVLLVAAGVAFWFVHKHHKTAPATVKQAQTATKAAAKVQGLQLDTKKNYGNKYANGILPVGDGKYSKTAAKAGYVYACSTYAQNLSSSQGGASTRGPWFTNNNTEYDVNKKVQVNGNVMWQSSFNMSLNGGKRVITTNDLPTHPTGIFPIASTDPAYAYDRNPNSIKGQTLTYTLTANPTYGSPQCMGGEAGVMLTGVALFNAFDAGGRDAGAWEVQDQCSGHPQSDGIYHYHTLSSCITDTSVSTVIGYALDGFPITGPKVGPNNILTTSDLDECHGIVSAVSLNNKQVTTYHYVMTQDFPYSVSCFRAIPSQTTPSGGGQSQGQSQTPSQGQPTGPPPPPARATPF